VSDKLFFYIKGRKKAAQPYHFKAAGLPNVYILNGFKLGPDKGYGETIQIVNLRGLMNAIGLHLLEKEDPMTGLEFRFLRKRLGYTQADLAQRMDLAELTISNYEKKDAVDKLASEYLKFQYSLYGLSGRPTLTMIKGLLGDHDGHKPVSSKTRTALGDGWIEPESIAA
jgi:transcriptional regulator with XRE-family HTH domain